LLGQKPEYILNNFSIDAIMRIYKILYKQRAELNGFEMKDTEKDDLEFEEIEKLYYTKEQIEELNKARNK
jgi:hypothetical protein